jgi:hypothetical protein
VDDAPNKRAISGALIDRRGDLASFRAKTRQRAEFVDDKEAKIAETEFEALYRLSSDHAAGLRELQRSLEHFLPHVQLVECERMLASLMNNRRRGSIGEQITCYGYYDYLTEARASGALSEDHLRIAHSVRLIRNEVFHEARPLAQDARRIINDFWTVMRQKTGACATLADELMLGAAMPIERIAQAQDIALRISNLAAFIEIEQMLRKVFDHLMRRDVVVMENINIPANGVSVGTVVNCILLSKGTVYHTLARLGFWDDLKNSVQHRHSLVHGRIEGSLSPAESQQVKRTWGVLRMLPQAILACRLVGRLETLLRELLASEGVGYDVVQKLWIQRLCRRLCDERNCMTLLASNGVGRGQIIWLGEFADQIMAKSLHPPGDAVLEKLRLLVSGISEAVYNPKKSFEIREHRGTRYLAESDKRNRIKHPKARRRGKQYD